MVALEVRPPTDTIWDRMVELLRASCVALVGEVLVQW